MDIRQPSLLDGMLFIGNGNLITPTQAVKRPDATACWAS